MAEIGRFPLWSSQRRRHSSKLRRLSGTGFGKRRIDCRFRLLANVVADSAPRLDIVGVPPLEDLRQGLDREAGHLIVSRVSLDRLSAQPQTKTEAAK